MKKFKMKNSPYITTKNDTKSIMLNVLISLIPLIAYNIYLHGMTVAVNMISAMVVSSVIEILFMAIFNKSNLWNRILSSYVFLPGLLLTLVLPVGVSLPVILIGSAIASLVKSIYSKIGKSFINPTLVGFLVVSLLVNYHSLINMGYMNGTIVIGALTSLTPLCLLIGFIYLLLTKAIKWRITVTYLLSYVIMIFFIGLYTGLGAWPTTIYTIVNLLSGGLIFASIYLATDTKTSPVSKGGQVLYGMLLGLVTVLLHYYVNLNSVECYAIIIMNLLVPFINNIGAQGRLNKEKIITPIVLVWILMSITTVIIGYSANHKIININKMGVVDEQKK